MRRDRESGSATVELALLAPGLLLLVGLLIFGGRNALAAGAVEQAAVDAARAASLARTGPDAQAAAHAAADRATADQGLACQSVTVQVDTSGFDTAPGQDGRVTAAVACTLRLSDLGLPGLPGTKTVSGSAVSVIDTYRERR
jgi:Flp pilus assembly protein TadG